VSGLSSALKRRFARVAVLPAAVADGKIEEAEFEKSLDKALEAITQTFDDVAIGDARAEVESNAEKIREIFGYLRGDHESSRLPIGTAQVIDTLVYALTLIIVKKNLGEAIDFDSLIDEALTARLTSAIESDRTRATISGEFLEDLGRELPNLSRLKKRLEAFHLGQE